MRPTTHLAKVSDKGKKQLRIFANFVEIMTNYSIIIPHKNIPELLERCLASIPQRDDVQVIVVDDGSDEKIVDFARFPGLGRKGVEVIFHKGAVGKNGAGVARNIGLDVAKGKWLVFADADDVFHPALGEAMDAHMNSEADIVFFRHDSMDNDTREIVRINTKRLQTLDDFEKTGDDTRVRYFIWVPWGKFVRREMVEKTGIRYDEVRFSSSQMFSVRTGHAAQGIAYDPAIVYCNVRRQGSLIHEGRRDWDAMAERFDVDLRSAKFVLNAGRGRIFENVVAERWGELAAIDRKKARALVPKLREVCSPRVIRNVRIKSLFRK